LRYYLQVGLIQPVELRGNATRYARRELLRLHYILRAKAAPGSKLKAIKRDLDALGESDLEAWLLRQPVAPNVLEALGLKARSAAPAPLAAFDGVAALSTEAWQRVRLLPGLELMVSAEASMEVKGIAQQICSLALGSRS
jgi:DNA-binding transcriptional MerR regulator